MSSPSSSLPLAIVVLISSWHHRGYNSNGNNSISLERSLRRVHDLVGNAVTRNRFINFGTGSTRLLNAAVYALSPDKLNNSSASAIIIVNAPNYMLIKRRNEMFDSRKSIWGGDTNKLGNLNASSGNRIIEYVTSPSNPEKCLKQSVINGSYGIYDHAYYWPHYSAISNPTDEDVMLFAASKLVSLADTRLGWAWVKDIKVYQKLRDYTRVNTLSVSRDAHIRILQVVKMMLANVGSKDGIFKFAHETLNKKWVKLSNVISSSNRFSCLNLVLRQDDFYHLLSKMKALVSKENNFVVHTYFGSSSNVTIICLRGERRGFRFALSTSIHRFSSTFMKISYLISCLLQSFCLSVYSLCLIIYVVHALFLV